MENKKSIVIPFQGFYNSWYSDAIDREQEQWAEYEAENLGRDDISESDLNDILWHCADYSAAYQRVARDYVDAFREYVNAESGFGLRLEFETMTSPEYYNFETDRIFCFIDSDDIARMYEEVKETPQFASLIKERHSSRDGFISFYKSDLESWLAKPFEEYDHNELKTVLLAWIQLRGHDVPANALDWEIYESMANSGDAFYSAFESCVDWKKYESKLADLIAEKDAENLALDPDYTPPYRCDSTLPLPL